MPFSLGLRSKQELQGVHPKLVAVVERAIQITEQDFGVHDGLRTHAEQVEYMRRGVSRTSRSKHLVQHDGYGHAVDLVPYINGKLRWEHEPCYLIAEAVRKAADALGVRIRWGGNWGELSGSKAPPHILQREYAESRIRSGQTAFLDSPHYELIT